MPSRFKPGTSVYAKDGRRYIVDEVADGLVYCTAPGGAEAEFAEAQLVTEIEWVERTVGRRDTLYTRLRQAKAFGPYKGNLDRAGSEQLLAKAERSVPGILDFTAFTVATKIVIEAGNDGPAPELSIVKCREVFDSTQPEVRATMLASLIGATPENLIGASRLGDNLIRAMLEKGLEARSAAFEDFSERPRN